MSKAVFLDTQIYLHYQPFDQVNWLDVLKVSEVIIVIPPIVVRELNKHKELHPRPRVKKRAGQVLKRLFSLFESAPRTHLCDNVEVWFEDRDPTIDFAAFQLSRDIQDDNLIASIIMFRNENPETEVVLVTSDVGLTLMAKANRLGIPTIRLPDRHKLPEEPDPEQARIKELEKELRELKLQVPQLSLVFEGGRQHAVFTLPHPIEPTQDELESAVKRIKQLHPKMEHQSQQIRKLPEHLASMAEAFASLNASFGNTIPPEDIDNYNTSLDKFYQAYGEYLKRNVRHQNLKRRAIELDIFVTNDGSAPAEDIDVFMHFPDGFRLTDTEGFPTSPRSPKPPPPPKTQMQKLHEAFSVPPAIVPSLTSYTSDLVLPATNVSALNIKQTGSYDVNFHVQKVKHKLQEPAEPLYVIFESFEAAQSFHIDYQILAANVANEVVGQLHVVIES
jgi:rRNA-processing protein FCF1